MKGPLVFVPMKGASGPLPFNVIVKEYYGTNAMKASSIHFGEDHQGLYFSYVDTETNVYHSVTLTRSQVYLLIKQAINIILEREPTNVSR